MYNPIIRTKQNKLPILKREEIDDIAEQFLMDFQPEVLKTPMEVDIDGFLECYLGATPERLSTGTKTSRIGRTATRWFTATIGSP